MERYQTYQYDNLIKVNMENSPVPFAVYQFIDKRVVTLVLSAGFCSLFGFEKEEAYQLMDRNMYRDTHPDDVARIADAAFLFATEEKEYDVIYRTKREYGWGIVHAKGKHVVTETGVRLAYVWYTDEGPYTEGDEKFEPEVNEMFLRSLRKESLYRKNYYDPLTGLPNMAYFLELAYLGKLRLLSQGIYPVLLFFDLNGMKYYNAQYGFEEGDKLLKGFARILARHFSNESCSRFAQDHFAAYTNEETAEEALQQIFEEASRLNDGKSLPVRVGIYRESMAPVDPAVAFDRAKYACDANRGAYKSEFYYFDEDMLAEANMRQYIINHLDQALEEKWIKVYYQPIVRAANGKVCDEEALARWADPVKGMLSPTAFIPVLESAQLIYKLDLYVLDQILEKKKYMKAQGLYIVPESLNLSRADFDSCDIVEEVRKRVDASGIPRDRLTIEITESTIGRDFEFMKEQVRRFRELGFQVWMDDFGSGYSSLDTLQDIRFDLIKFDMRFMQQFEEGEESKIILTELVRMAGGLGIDTLAEGVETKEQADFLREIGCNKLQGYYFCNPIPAEEIVERNRKGIQIGFENPDEADYFATIGKVNLYDQAIAAEDIKTERKHFFHTLPVAILELDAEGVWVVRSNRAYRDFIETCYPNAFLGDKYAYADLRKWISARFTDALEECRQPGKRVFRTGEISQGLITHYIVRHIATNPVTGISACAVIILGLTDSSDLGAIYTRIAQALSADYINLYYIDLDTEEFTEYNSNPWRENLTLERHDDDFFRKSRRDALDFIYEKDRDYFISNFTRENVIETIDREGSFNLNYQLLMDGKPRYVNLKAVRVGANNHIVMGVNNVDSQMRQKEMLERMQAEQVTYKRVMALTGDFICIYSVNPWTDDYILYSASRKYETLGLTHQGKHFFAKAKEDSLRAIVDEDRQAFLASFTKENILQEIEQDGLYELEYRLMFDDEPMRVRLRAALVEEKDGSKLIIGVNNINARGKQDATTQEE